MNLRLEEENIKFIKKNEEQEKLIKYIKNFIKKNQSKFKNIDSILVFGSLTSGTFTDESDIDICIFLKKNTPKAIENNIFSNFLDLEKKIDRLVQCIFIYPEEIENWDSNFIENILAEGRLIYGTSNFLEIPFKTLKLKPFLIIKFNLRELDKSIKMKIKRMLYGYQTKKRYFKKVYQYQKDGLVQEIKGFKLGRGAFLIPEKYLWLIENKFMEYNVNFTHFRVWLQEE